MDRSLKSYLQNVKGISQFVIVLPKLIYFLFFYFKYLINPKSSNFPKNRSIAYRTNGVSLNLAHAIGKRRYKNFSPENSNKPGLLKLSEQDFSQARNSMKELGFWISPNQIEINKLDLFYTAAIKNLSKLKNVNIEISKIDTISTSWQQDMVNLDTQWVMEQELTLDLATDSEILRIAGEYLEAPPVLNHPESWFSFPVKNVQKESAKNWHWDCDGVKWIKVFVYINNVDLTNGPHAFVEKSHMNWKVNDKSTRVTEDEILSAYGQKAIKSFTAARGTVIFEDTRGFHRGTPLLVGHRLVLQLQFNLDTFSLGKSEIKLPESYLKSFAGTPRVLDYFAQ
jgi:hypothetical protein